MKRDKVIRLGAIIIALALFLSLLAGAFSVSPSQAAGIESQTKSVHIFSGDNSPVGGDLDTDGDGIINNEDPDIDGDGIVNANDGDIDGDGTSNFDDGDPADTNGFDGKTPNKPGSISIENLTESGLIFWLIGAAVLTLGLALLFWRKTSKNQAKSAEKNI